MKVGGNFRLISDAQKFASRGSMKSGLRGEHRRGMDFDRFDRLSQ